MVPRQQAGGREAQRPATRRRYTKHGEAFVCSNTMLGGRLARTIRAPARVEAKRTRRRFGFDRAAGATPPSASDEIALCEHSFGCRLRRRRWRARERRRFRIWGRHRARGPRRGTEAAALNCARRFQSKIADIDRRRILRRTVATEAAARCNGPDSYPRNDVSPPNGSGVELRRPGTRFLDDITLQAGRREANRPARGGGDPKHSEAYGCSNTVLGSARRYGSGFSGDALACGCQ